MTLLPSLRKGRVRWSFSVGNRGQKFARFHVHPQTFRSCQSMLLKVLPVLQALTTTEMILAA